MIVVWTPEAEQDRADIWDYIADDNPSAAVRMDALFSAAAARLAAHPKLGKAGKVAGTRELVAHESYRLVYEIDGSTVWVLALVHTARRCATSDALARGAGCRRCACAIWYCLNCWHSLAPGAAPGAGQFRPVRPSVRHVCGAILCRSAAAPAGRVLERLGLILRALTCRFCNHLILLDILVGRAGFEPATNGLKVRCSTN